MDKLATMSPPSKALSDNFAKLEEVKKRAAYMLGCYRRGDANDPEVYATAIIGTLMCFPIEVVREVTDPVFGMPARFKWLPTIAEVREESEAIFSKRMAAVAQANRIDRQLAERAQFEREQTVERAERLTYEQLKEKYGDWNINSVKSKPFNVGAFRDKLGISVEDWNNIPEAPRGPSST